jgi:nucleoid-associated protein YgaU
MPRAVLLATIAAALAVPAAPRAAEDGGKVTMTLPDWEVMLDELEAEQEPAPPPVDVCRIDRRIDGVFAKGLFSATLTETFEVIDERGHVRVPVLDGEMSLGEVLLDGKRTSLLREGDMYTLGVDGPGIYRVRLKFFWGEDRDRFSRRLRFRLPEGGVTGISVLLPERDIDVRLAAGALTREEARPGGTLLEGNIDASGVFDLSWTRKLTHRGSEAVKIESRLDTVFTVGEALITGRTAFDINVLEGETDMIELDLPEGIEVLKVDGDAVLQWHTEATGGGRLSVLLRYLVADRARITVHFQSPADTGGPVDLKMPLPVDGVPMTGAAGVQGPAGLDIKAVAIENATELGSRDLPPELTDLTTSPLLFGFSFTTPPKIQVAVSRQEQVSLTSTLIEELQASTVLVEDGTEITKVKLKMRNNTKEFLTIALPAKAVLTHSLIDGQPVRPAITGKGGDEKLLFPLRQSERIREGETRMHTVRPGETLSDIANFYYSDPSKWSEVLEGNQGQLYSADSLSAGQSLKIPDTKGVSVEESSFVIELAYKAHRDPLGNAGRIAVQLPELDVDTMRVIWHLYMPVALSALRFDANLTQYSAIRYDPFRRIRDFIDDAMWIGHAWAGAKYENILAQRKVIYRAETGRRGKGEVIRAAFPLVGERYRFKRILLGRETPSIEVTYVATGAVAAVHWLTLIAAFVITLLVLSRPREIKVWVGAAVALAALLLLAHYFLGMHRRLVWGIDLALIVALVRLRAGPLWQGIRQLAQSPWSVLELFTIRNLLFVIGVLAAMMFVLAFPLFTSLTAMVLLIVWWRRKSGQAAREVQHA